MAQEIKTISSRGVNCYYLVTIDAGFILPARRHLQQADSHPTPGGTA